MSKTRKNHTKLPLPAARLLPRLCWCVLDYGPGCQAGAFAFSCVAAGRHCKKKKHEPASPYLVDRVAEGILGPQDVTDAIDLVDTLVWAQQRMVTGPEARQRRTPQPHAQLHGPAVNAQIPGGVRLELVVNVTYSRPSQSFIYRYCHRTESISARATPASHQREGSRASLEPTVEPIAIDCTSFIWNPAPSAVLNTSKDRRA